MQPSARLDVRLVPAALTSWLVTAAGVLWPVGFVLATLGGALAAAAVGLWWRADRAGWDRLRVLGASLVAVGVVGAGFGTAVALRADAARQHPITAAFGTVAPVTVTPSESAVAVGSRRLMFRATLQRLGGDTMSGRVVVFAPTMEFHEVMVGRSLAFRARITPPTRRDLTVAVLTASGAPRLGRAGLTQRAAHAVRTRFAAVAAEVLPGEQARILPALVLGDTAAVTATTSREFRAANLMHLMAVSGANVTIVCGAVLFLARLIGPRAAVALAALALVAFVVVVQPTASVLRAAVMGAIALLGVLSSRRRQAIPSLSASVLVLMVAAPQLAVDIGFALSVVATAALIVIAPVWSRGLVARGWPKPVADAVCVAGAAQAVTAPLIAAISGRVSLVGAFANLAVAALVVPITVLGSAAAALCVCWPAAAQLLIRFTGPELWWVGRIAHWTAGLPGATVPVPAGVPGAAVVLAATTAAVAAWRWWWFRLTAAGAAVCLLAWSASGVLTGQVGVQVGALSAPRDTISG
ncbi:ComEC/Rec2 family competence protein [Mycobacterium sp. pUA109]|uniref:ComEC/Rec2 family competence protein n=1 Tax=Mycobacterium sp. pUA109 TaxID=3238982 RepID=UPI00351B6C41